MVWRFCELEVLWPRDAMTWKYCGQEWMWPGSAGTWRGCSLECVKIATEYVVLLAVSSDNACLNAEPGSTETSASVKYVKKSLTCKK